MQLPRLIRTNHAANNDEKGIQIQLHNTPGPGTLCSLLNYIALALGKVENTDDVFEGGKLDERVSFPVGAICCSSKDVSRELLLHSGNRFDLGQSERLAAVVELFCFSVVRIVVFFFDP